MYLLCDFLLISLDIAIHFCSTYLLIVIRKFHLDWVLYLEGLALGQSHSYAVIHCRLSVYLSVCFCYVLQARDFVAQALNMGHICAYVARVLSYLFFFTLMPITLEYFEIFNFKF